MSASSAPRRSGSPTPTAVASLATSAPLIDPPRKPPPESAADCKQALSDVVNVHGLATGGDFGFVRCTPFDEAL